jgi:uracil-DNA glycosylase
MPRLIKNLFPSISTEYKLAIILDSPSEDELTSGTPLQGYPGQYAQAAFSGAKIISSALFFGHLRNYSYKPPYDYDKKAVFSDETEEFRDSKKQLREDLISFSPNCILLLGPESLYYAGIRHSLRDYRGSLFTCCDSDSPFFGFKCLSSFHPSKFLKEYSLRPIFSFDVKRAATEALTPTLSLPERTMHVELSYSQLLSKLSSIPDSSTISVDIEGGIPNPLADKPEYRFPSGITCIGIATSPYEAFIVNHQDFDASERCSIIRALAKVLMNPSIGKVLQNGLYDNFCLSWLYKCPILNVIWDTMLAGWQRFPELKKSLAMLTSVDTRQPYYKFERKIADKLTHHKYCCMDACVTYEIYLVQKSSLEKQPEALSHHLFTQSLLPAILYMELRGIRYNLLAASEALSSVTLEMSLLQSTINSTLKSELNINSPKQMQVALYQKLGFEPHYAKENGRLTSRLTTDVEALLDIYRKTSSQFILNILLWRQFESQRKQLLISSDPDGRVRCGYNLVGTDTGRLACKESPTGSGSNLTTIMKPLRSMFQADEGYDFFQCDLSGADGWTVAAWCKELGDPTMWDDYLAGIKPALVIAALYLEGVSLSRLPRSELKDALNRLKPKMPKWLYPAAKAVQHGSNYDMKPNTMSLNILKQSWKKANDPIYVSPKDCQKLQTLYLGHRYSGVAKWQEYVKNTLERTGKLKCASGHTRIFFDRLKDQATFRTALSQEPQHVTTYVTNLALKRLWEDPIIQPLHTIHDALAGQYPSHLRSWALPKLRSYFDNEISIANQKLTIPFEGSYGPSWGELPETPNI